MKAHLEHIVLLSLFSFLALTIGITSCNLFGEENPDCGARETHTEYITANDVALYSVLGGDSIREYSYSFSLGDMCPHEHINVKWEVLGVDLAGWQGEYAADVYWTGSGIYEQKAQFSRDGLKFVAEQDIDFKQAFGDQPANAIFSFYVKFRTRGSIGNDDLFLLTSLTQATAEVTFYYALSP